MGGRQQAPILQVHYSASSHLTNPETECLADHLQVPVRALYNNVHRHLEINETKVRRFRMMCMGRMHYPWQDARVGVVVIPELLALARRRTDYYHGALRTVVKTVFEFPERPSDHPPLFDNELLTRVETMLRRVVVDVDKVQGRKQADITRSISLEMLDELGIIKYCTAKKA
jgi:hypothetical protein